MTKSKADLRKLPNLVLASSSPYRRELLERLHIDFSCESPDIDESRYADESAENLVKRLALEKARCIAKRHEDALIIGSDQVAVIDDQILGKPGTIKIAQQQLRQASGRCVRFLTGLCLFNSASGEYQLDLVPFSVHFRTLNAIQIAAYVEKEQPLNCAGSFKSEGLGISLFEKMDGEDPNALIGLPLIRLITMLKTEGFEVLS